MQSRRDNKQSWTFINCYQWKQIIQFEMKFKNHSHGLFLLVITYILFSYHLPDQWNLFFLEKVVADQINSFLVLPHKVTPFFYKNSSCFTSGLLPPTGRMLKCVRIREWEKAVIPSFLQWCLKFIVRDWAGRRMCCNLQTLKAGVKHWVPWGLCLSRTEIIIHKPQRVFLWDCCLNGKMLCFLIVEWSQFLQIINPFVKWLWRFQSSIYFIYL